MPTEIKTLQAEIKELKGELAMFNKALLALMYQHKALQELLVVNETNKAWLTKRINELFGEYSKEIRSNIARVEGNDILYRLFNNNANSASDGNIES